jgi:C-terminal processing protease CtpA/Prc
VAWLPSWIDAAPDGTPIEGRGVAPDVPVVFDRADPGDTVLAAAVARERDR